jgi:hypothetical protein
MTKTRVRNAISRIIPRSLDDNMFAERSELIRAIVDTCGTSQQFCHTLVWKTDSGITITLNSFDLVIEIEDELTVSDFVMDFSRKWIVAHIDCATNEVRDLLNKICDIYAVDRIF